MDRLRWTAQFYGRAEHSAVVAGLWRERELRVRLAELHRYRLAGVTRLEECAHYEQHAAHRKHPNAQPHHLDVRPPLLVSFALCLLNAADVTIYSARIFHIAT
ncbi:Transcriptional adapter 2B [Eumeta japonica]|uniref:Transcriptional adapter 2B n=1 Tax=Eumeta variegata TaxID=151549 RepID=A0A4C1SRQ0_EUMVA|nr:Transcriptional adapter 2B [Eumeta japonica]